MELNIDVILKYGATLISLFCTLFIFKPNIITFFTSSKSERMLLNKELRKLYDISVFIFFFVTIPFVITHDTVKQKGIIYSFVDTNIQYFLYIILVGFIFSIFFNIRFKRYKHIRFKLYNFKDVSNNRLRIEFIFMYLFLWFVFLTSSTIVFGIILNLACVEKSVPSIATVIAYTPLYILQLYPFRRILNKLIYEEVKAKIILTNGQVICNAFVLHPTYGSKILIGDKPEQVYCTQLIAIPKDKIEYIEFLVTPKAYYDPKDYKNSKIIISSYETRQQILKNVEDIQKNLKL
ncbi:hypothetical protein AT864_01475 [Anoxybacillus sp. P3H1B]|uniref:hypothetical protein n=1 Tax=Anoxybacillus sp. P3H1B TaxID=1769293 RepID=UPI000792CA2A|nr:hypothetical protein [Anoxybacillus sp. P3H1B]KXG09915.1 hypothetical protein AT864_01475 [Anoxybacillus sp. P3H1B]